MFRTSDFCGIRILNQNFLGWWSWTESNRRPPACKAGALPTELQPLPEKKLVGLGRLELPTSRLSSARSNQLSYRPETRSPYSWIGRRRDAPTAVQVVLLRSIKKENSLRIILRKEVIQPQVPLRLPCYDFTPVADLTVAGCLKS